MRAVICQINAIRDMMINYDDGEVRAVINALTAAENDLLDELTRRANDRARFEAHQAARTRPGKHIKSTRDDRG